MTPETARVIQSRLSVAANVLKQAGELGADAAAARVRHIRDVLGAGDDSTARPDLAVVVEGLKGLKAAPQQVTDTYAQAIEKQAPELLPGVARAIEQIEKALKL